MADLDLTLQLMEKARVLLLTEDRRRELVKMAKEIAKTGKSEEYSASQSTDIKCSSKKSPSVKTKSV